MYRWLYKNFLSKMDAEKAHNMALWFLRKSSRSETISKLMNRKVPKDDRLNIDVAGIRFNNPIGMAAGFDKEGYVFPSLFSLGFGHVEVGTMTFHPRNGKQKPRVWRLDNRELFNCMGLPNSGYLKICKNISSYKFDGIIGASISPELEFNIGRTDEDTLFRIYNALTSYVDYITINLSCPNVREDGLYDEERILCSILKNRKFFNSMGMKDIPFFMKMGPSLTYPEPNFKPTFDFDILKKRLDLLLKYEMSGVILVNTFPDVININGIRTRGGRSGHFLKEYGIRSVQAAYKHTGGNLPIIGVGGIEKDVDALTYIKCGASLVQLYTGFVIHGPRTPVRILNGILYNLNENQKIKDIVGDWA